MKEALFGLEGYNFPKVMLDFSNVQPLNNSYKLAIEPEGEFDAQAGKFTLTFRFVAMIQVGEEMKSCVEVVCVGLFTFKDVRAVEDIPSYFYANSIAILFPYVRAFVSTLSLQANYTPIVLPTMNLSDLSTVLKKHVKVVK